MAEPSTYEPAEPGSPSSLPQFATIQDSVVRGEPEAAEGGTGVDLGVRVEGVGLPVAGGGGVGVAGQLGEAALLYRETHGDH